MSAHYDHRNVFAYSLENKTFQSAFVLGLPNFHFLFEQDFGALQGPEHHLLTEELEVLTGELLSGLKFLFALD